MVGGGGGEGARKYLNGQESCEGLRQKKSKILKCEKSSCIFFDDDSLLVVSLPSLPSMSSMSSVTSMLLLVSLASLTSVSSLVSVPLVWF